MPKPVDILKPWRRKGKGGFYIELVTKDHKPLRVVLDAMELASRGSQVLGREVLGALDRGVDPETGAPHKPPSRAKGFGAKRFNKGPRMVRTGHFRKSLIRSRVRGDSLIARAWIGPEQNARPVEISDNGDKFSRVGFGSTRRGLRELGGRKGSGATTLWAIVKREWREKHESYFGGGGAMEITARSVATQYKDELASQIDPRIRSGQTGLRGLTGGREITSMGKRKLTGLRPGPRWWGAAGKRWAK